MSRLTRDGTAEPVSRDQILRQERGYCSTNYEQDWQPYLIDSYSCYMCYNTYMHAPRQPHAVTTVVYPPFFFFFFFSFLSLENLDVAFSEYFCTINVFSLYGVCVCVWRKYVVRFPLPGGVFLPCDHGLDF